MAGRGNIPLGYLITFSTYGSWLHGEEKGSVDKGHNTFGSKFVRPSGAMRDWELSQAKTIPVLLDAEKRKAVLEAVIEVCEFRGWGLIACHVRRNHVHLVIATSDKPEKVMVDCKAYATRLLRTKCLQEKGSKVWTKHGSTRYLWNEDQLAGAIRYVIDEQGRPMQWYAADRRPNVSAGVYG